MANNTQTNEHVRGHVQRTSVDYMNPKKPRYKDYINLILFVESATNHILKITNTETGGPLSEKRKVRYREVRQVAQAYFYQFIPIISLPLPQNSLCDKKSKKESLIFAFLSEGKFQLLIVNDNRENVEINARDLCVKPIKRDLRTADELNSFLKKMPLLVPTFFDMADKISHFNSKFLHFPDLFFDENLNLPLTTN